MLSLKGGKKSIITENINAIKTCYSSVSPGSTPQAAAGFAPF